MSDSDDVITSVDDGLAKLRAAVAQQLGVERPPAADVDPARLPRFSADLPEEHADEERAALLARARELDPWLQGPFYLGGDVVIGGAWRNDLRWLGFGERVPQDLSGKRVLDVGSNAGYDPFMFHLRGARDIVACEPFQFIEQARFLESIYRTGIDFQPIGWQALDPERYGTFDLIHCHGVLYHELHPMAMLARLRPMLADGGTLFFGSMMLEDPQLSEYARFVPGAYYGDPTWWWVPGRLAMRWMLEGAGFEVRDLFGLHAGPPGEFRTVNGYFEAGPGTPDPHATAIS
jgi:tRNA (mo5U34)-methyltransferase